MDLSKLRPLGDRVIVKVDDAEDKSAGGIIIPDNAKEPLTRGVIIAVGPGKRGDEGNVREPRVKKGERVIFGKYAGSEIQGTDQRDRHMMLTEDDLLAAVDD
jgi:chaperonin GroES